MMRISQVVYRHFEYEAPILRLADFVENLECGCSLRNQVVVCWEHSFELIPRTLQTNSVWHRFD